MVKDKDSEIIRKIYDKVEVISIDVARIEEHIKSQNDKVSTLENSCKDLYCKNNENKGFIDNMRGGLKVVAAMSVLAAFLSILKLTGFM